MLQCMSLRQSFSIYRGKYRDMFFFLSNGGYINHAGKEEGLKPMG